MIKDNSEYLEEYLTSERVLAQQEKLIFSKFDLEELHKIGAYALELFERKDYPMAVEIRISDWKALHISFPGTSPENDWWMNRKSKVVNLTGNSSLYERLLSEEGKYDWFEKKKVSEEDFAIHGGGFPIKTEKIGLIGVILVSGLPHLMDHQIAYELLEKVHI